GTEEESRVNSQLIFPSPWNNLEAGILYTLRKPLIIFKEDGITDEIFDEGVSEFFIHKMSIINNTDNALRETLLKWQGLVRTHYYED
ncbi:MAG TPA: hypothetical protein VEC36_08640, partial [Patescibacteria group bacterium]|nr:hypothetical protein [Patescibacteria group bacterium]